MFIKYEEMLINSKPAPFTTLNEGFIINYAGFEQFTSSIHPLYSRDKELKSKIFDCEEILKNYNIVPEFRIVFQKDYQPLDEELFKHGYERNGQGTVKMIDIKSLQNELFTFANFIENGVYIEDSIKDFWLSDHSYLMNLSSEHDRIYKACMKKVIVKSATFTLIEENTLIGQGFVTFQKEFMIIGNIIINPKFRTLSYAKRLLMSMLSYGLKKGAAVAIADVDYENTPANKLFAKVKFEDIYGYCYRIKKL